MRLLSVLVLAGFLVFAGSAFGSECADFTGTWTGPCTVSNGTTLNYTLKILQTDCQHYSEDGQPSVIGALNQHSSSTADRDGAHIDVMDWSSDQQTLLWTASGHSRDRVTGKTHSEFGNGSYSLVNGHFILKSTFSFVDRDGDQEKSWSASYVCDMQKQ